MYEVTIMNKYQIQWIKDTRKYEERIRDLSVKDLMKKSEILQMKYVLRSALDLLEQVIYEQQKQD